MYTDREDEREIYRNIVAVARAMDARDWAKIEELAIPDASAEFGSGPLSSAAEIIGLLRQFLDNCGPTQHMVGNVEIEVDGDSAVSRAYVADMHLGTGELEGQFFRTLGDYHDSWTRTDSGWKLARRVKTHSGLLGNMAVLGHAATVPEE